MTSKSSFNLKLRLTISCKWALDFAFHFVSCCVLVLLTMNKSNIFDFDKLSTRNVVVVLYFQGVNLVNGVLAAQ
jgi:hypothetical protein